MTVILGLDVSSSTIGWGLIKNNKLIDYGHIKPLKSDFNIFERLNDINLQIKKLLNKHKPEYIVIEDILLFMPKKSSAQTITTLAIFNRTVGLTCYNYLEKPPELIPAPTIRKIIRHKYNIDALKKEDIPQVINTHLGNFHIELKIKGKKAGQPKDYIYDQADGIAAAWCLSIQMEK